MVPYLLTAFLTSVTAGLLLVTGYLVVLTLAALWAQAAAPRAVPPAGPARRRFAVLVPAHNEELLLGRLLENLRHLDYPSDGFHVYVVADNCVDRTAALARSLGARVYERGDRMRQGKGFALRWLLERIRAAGDGYDAFVVLDADSVVAPNFLRRMDARLEAGSQVIQAYYSVLNAGASPAAGLRNAALAAVHYLRPLGRSALGLSCGLKGNGMCFAAPILQQFAWNWFTLAEDVEFHLALVRDGVRVDFAPETSVWSDMPLTLAQAASQNARWERGRLHLLRRRVPGLVVEGLRRRSPLRLDAAAEQCIPPLSVPFALGSLCLIAGIGLGAGPPTALAALDLGGQVFYLLAGLVLVRAPLSTYLALSRAPLYIVWKVGLYGQAVVSTRRPRWVRTARAPGPGGPRESQLPQVPAVHRAAVHGGGRR
jgi:cellulose synthase/poly-beta-1,6-N-acetylglucosamine synthase-like glycosyltransferase